MPTDIMYYLQKQRRLSIGLLIGLFWLAGCAGDHPFDSSPATGQHAGQYYPGKFVWHDLLTNDTAAAERFYAELFGWRFKQLSEIDGAMILNRGKVIGRIADHFRNTVAAENAIWLSSVSVMEVTKASKMAQRLGGEVLDAPQRIEGRGETALIADSQGAVLVLLHSATGDHADTDVQPGDWLWMELWTHDIDKAAYFYKKLLGFSIDAVESNDEPSYLLLKDGGIKRAGIVKLTAKQIKPNWLPYVRVTDITATITKVTQLGGRVVMPPDPQYERGRVAVIADPTGGVLAVQQL